MQPANLTANKRIAIVAIFLCVSFLSAELTSAQPGSLDPTFGNGGKVVTDFGSSNDYCFAFDIQEDGKIVAGGESNNNITLVRYNMNGDLDSDFGTNGKVIGNVGHVRALKVQKDGKIIMAGNNSASSNPLWLLTRYTSNGTLNSSFGINGIVISQIGISGLIYSLAIQDDNKIIAAGYSYTPVGGTVLDQFAVVRYNTNGSIDSTFGVNGIVITNFGTMFDRCTAVAIQGDGKIVCSGHVYGVDNGADAIFTASIRYNQDGSVDSSYGTNGKTMVNLNLTRAALTALFIQNDGKILIAGNSSINTTIGFSVIRYTVDGIPDNSFGTNGIKITDLGALSDGGGNATLIVDKNDNILQVGITKDGDYYHFVLLRYKDNGKLDSSFGNNGIVITSFNNNGDENATGIALQKNGKILVTGYASNGTDNDFALARYDTSSTLPITLTSFIATKQKASVLLNWQTVSEQNNAYFSVERSNNGNNFSEIGKVNSKGNSNRLQEYSFTDAQPFNGENYYRLRQVDKDGHYTYSKVVSADFAVTLIYKLYPNPAKDMLHLNGLNAATATTVSLIALDGRMIDKKIISASSYDWNTKSLAAGTYYLRIEENKKVTTLKFIKQ